MRRGSCLSGLPKRVALKQLSPSRETYDPKVLATWRAYGTRGNAAKAYDLYAKAYDGGVQAAKDRSQSTIISEGERKPASWFGREEAD